MQILHLITQTVTAALSAMRWKTMIAVFALLSAMAAVSLTLSAQMPANIVVGTMDTTNVRSRIMIDEVGKFSDNLFAPNADKIKQSITIRSLTGAGERIDLGDGLFLLGNDDDPSNSLLEAKISASQWSSLITGNTNVLRNISNLAYDKFKDDFDFIFFVLNTPYDQNIINSLGYVGINFGISNQIQGLGLSAYNLASSWGSAGKLKSSMFFPYYDAILLGPALHELCHNWAAFICPTYAPDNSRYDGHWGISNAGGQLGGFKYVRVVEHNSGGVPGKTLYQASFSSNETNPDGSFKYPGFGVNANRGNSARYSDIELYLMGLNSAQDLRNAGFTLDIYSGNDYHYDGPLSFSNGYFYSTIKTSYTIDDIIAQNGVRIPDVSTSQKQFKVLTIAITSETASDDYCADIIENVGWFAGAIDDVTNQGWVYNFRQATYNTSSLTVENIINSLKQTIAKPGDINGDGKVDAADLSMLIADFGKSGAAITNPAADINGDGKVDSADLSILIANYGN